MLTNGMFLVDRYEILSKVGVGGMADVYKAKDHILGRVVAIKVLKAELSEDINFVTKFRTEAQSAAGLEHQNIVNIYDVGSENGLHFIVMEHVEGITLKTYIEKKGQLTFKEAVSIAIQVARGIEAAHNKNITHRDIKPQNIIISTEGKVKVTDFGIAKAISSNTISSDAMGSVHYASPEQARNGFVDGRSDIYSLGIVMYEMVTGRVPFDGETTVAVALQHLQEEMVEPSAYAQDLPISYEKIVLKTTQKSPERRYQNIAELLVDLRQALITPDEDFVVITPLATGSTRVINGEELETIQNKAEEVDLKSETKFVAAKEEKEEEVAEAAEEEIDDDSEDASGFLDPKMEKIVTVAGVGVLILIIAIVIYLFGSIVLDMFKFGSSGTASQKPNTEVSTGDTNQNTDVVTSENESETDTVVPEQVEVINLVNMKVDAATSALQEKGLTLNIITYRADDSVEDNVILEQSPSAGDTVSKGTVISVVVSGLGEQQLFEVPDVVGDSESEAISNLEGQGFLVERKYETSDDVEAGKVISQSIERGNHKPAGTRIQIVISEGKGKALVPADLVGKTIEEAIQKIEAVGFVVEERETVSDKYPTPGTVTKVEGAGANREIGSTIIVHVSSGPETVIPDTYSYDKTWDNEEATSYKFELKDADGNVLSSGTGEGNKVRIHKNAITTSTGTLTIEWYKEVTTSEMVQSDKDENGDGIVSQDDLKEEITTSTETIRTYNESVSFDVEQR